MLRKFTLNIGILVPRCYVDNFICPRCPGDILSAFGRAISRKKKGPVRGLLPTSVNG